MHNLSSLINNKYKLIGVDMMSPKELLYIQDALGHAQHMEKKCRECASQLSNEDLKQLVEKIANKQKMIFDQFYQLLNQ